MQDLYWNIPRNDQILSGLWASHDWATLNWDKMATMILYPSSAYHILYTEDLEHK
jgi:hypothetical protein